MKTSAKDKFCLKGLCFLLAMQKGQSQQFISLQGSIYDGYTMNNSVRDGYALLFFSKIISGISVISYLALASLLEQEYPANTTAIERLSKDGTPIFYALMHSKHFSLQHSNKISPREKYCVAQQKNSFTTVCQSSKE